MPRIKDRHHGDVLVDGDVIQHTYKGRTWTARYTGGLFTDIENPECVYYTPTEFANSHLAVKTGVNGLRACKVRRGDTLVPIANLFGVVASAPAPASAPAVETSPPKPKLTFQSMKKRVASGTPSEATQEKPVAAPAPAPAPPPKKRKAPATQVAKKAQVAVVDAPPSLIKIITPRMVESKDEPLEIFEIEEVVVEEVCVDGTKYYKDTHSETLYIFEDGQVGAAIRKYGEDEGGGSGY